MRVGVCVGGWAGRCGSECGGGMGAGELGGGVGVGNLGGSRPAASAKIISRSRHWFNFLFENRSCVDFSEGNEVRS